MKIESTLHSLINALSIVDELRKTVDGIESERDRLRGQRDRLVKLIKDQDQVDDLLTANQWLVEQAALFAEIEKESGQ